MQIIETAREYVPQAQMRSSAQLCVDDAQSLADAGFAVLAFDRALKSLAYSIGVCHPIYRGFAEARR